MKKSVLLLSVLFLFGCAASPGEVPAPRLSLSAALEILKQGNERYAAGKFSLPSPDAEEARRASTSANGQAPVAAILSCSDSRVPAERIFSAGLGDIFVIRTAGNTAGRDQTASVEYAVHHLHVPLIVILGHTKCGAVSAAISGAKEQGALAELIRGIARTTAPALKLPPEKRMDAAVRLSVDEAERSLKKSGTISAALKKGSVKIVKGVYDIETGRVLFAEN